MEVLIKAPKCKDGIVKNHKSLIGNEIVTWINGIAKMEEETWELLKGISGYSLINNNIPEPIIVEENQQPIGVNTDKITKASIEFPTIDNTVKEIKGFASKCVPQIDLSKAKTKSQMIERIKAHFA